MTFIINVILGVCIISYRAVSHSVVAKLMINLKTMIILRRMLSINLLMNHLLTSLGSMWQISVKGRTSKVTQSNKFKDFLIG